MSPEDIISGLGQPFDPQAGPRALAKTFFPDITRYFTEAPPPPDITANKAGKVPSAGNPYTGPAIREALDRASWLVPGPGEATGAATHAAPMLAGLGILGSHLGPEEKMIAELEHLLEKNPGASIMDFAKGGGGAMEGLKPPPVSGYTYIPSAVDYKSIANAYAEKWKALFEDKGIKQKPPSYAERLLKDLPKDYEKKFKEEDFSKLKLSLPETMSDEAKQAHLDQINGILKALKVPESHIKGLGFNTEFPLYKGVSLEGTSFKDPAEKAYERAQFLSDDPRIAQAYGAGPNDVHSFFARPRSTLSADWKDLTGKTGYDSSDMDRAIEFARKNQADMLILRNMKDLGSYAPQNQYPVINTSILRKPEAVFDPRRLKYNDLLAGLAGAGIVGGLGGQDAEH